MKDIKQYEDAIANQVASLTGAGINGTMFWAYRDSKKANCEELNFYEVIWEKDIDEIVETCRKEKIGTITISSGYSSLTTTLWEFVKRGCTIEGMKLVPQPYTEYNWETKEEVRPQTPAIVIKIN